MEEHEYYPEKPFIEKVKVESNWGLTVFSIVLFVGVFLLVFNDQLQFVLFLILVLFIHEMGHYAFMKLYKYENVRMLFIPLMGAFVQGTKDKYSQKQSFIVVSAGPFPGLYLGVVLLILSSIYKFDWFIELSFLFLFLNVINLLPIDPLDGGQLFKLMVNRKRDLFLLIFALLSSLTLIGFGFLINSWMMIGFGFIMAIKIRSIQRNYIIRKKLDQLNVNYISTYEELPNRSYALIRDVVIEETPTLRKYLEISEESNDDVLASHVNSVLIAPITYDVSKIVKFFFVLFWLFSISLPFILVLSNFLNFDWYFEKL
ncbi:MAG: site-2 protease family protein [Crocinitomicaceae bacterium]